MLLGLVLFSIVRDEGTVCLSGFEMHRKCFNGSYKKKLAVHRHVLPNNSQMHDWDALVLRKTL